MLTPADAERPLGTRKGQALRGWRQALRELLFGTRETGACGSRAVHEFNGLLRTAVRPPSKRIEPSVKSPRRWSWRHSPAPISFATPPFNGARASGSCTASGGRAGLRAGVRPVHARDVEHAIDQPGRFGKPPVARGRECFSCGGFSAGDRPRPEPRLRRARGPRSTARAPVRGQLRETHSLSRPWRGC